MTPSGIKPATFLLVIIMFVVYSAALSRPSHVFYNFLFCRGNTKIIFHTPWNPPLMTTFTGQKSFIAGSRIEFLRNYCLDNLFVKFFCTWKSAYIVRKEFNHVCCLLFGIYTTFEGISEFFSVSQFLALYSRTSDAVPDDVLLNTGRELWSEMLYIVGDKWLSECGCGAMVK
jgi:hypothetical protein